jgi:hypothetical protein
VASKPGGLNVRNGDDLETPSAVKSLERTDAGNRPIGGTWGRPTTLGKKQAGAPGDPPGSWPKHPGKDLQSNVEKDHLPAGAGSNLQRLPGISVEHEILVEDCDLAHELVGAVKEG